MGATQSVTNNKMVQEQNQISTTDITSTSKQLTQKFSENTMEEAKNCSASSTMRNLFLMSQLDLVNDLVIDNVTQKNTAKVTLSCVNESKIQNAIASNLVTTALSGLEKRFDSNILSQVEATAKAQASQGFGSVGLVNSNTNISSSNKSNIQNKERQNIENVIMNSFNEKFSTKAISDCTAQVKNENEFIVDNVKAKGIKIGVINQESAAEVLGTCQQMSEALSTVLTDSASKLGLQVKSETAAKAEQETKTTAETTAKMEGIGDVIGKLMAMGPIVIIAVVAVVGFLAWKNKDLVIKIFAPPLAFAIKHKKACAILVICLVGFIVLVKVL